MSRLQRLLGVLLAIGSAVAFVITVVYAPGGLAP